MSRLGALCALGCTLSCTPLAAQDVVDRLADRMVGVWDNDNQIYFETNGFLQSQGAPEVTEPHTRMRVYLEPVDLDWLGQRVLFLEHFAGSLEKPYRQQLLALRGDGDSVVQTNHVLVEPQDLRALLADPARLKALERDDLRPAVGEGCAFRWVPTDEGFEGSMPKESCRIESRRHPGEKRLIASRRTLIGNTLEMDEAGYKEDGSRAFGRKDGVPHRLRRAQSFRCWFAVHPEVGKAAPEELASRNEYEEKADWSMVRFDRALDRGETMQLPQPTPESPRYTAILRQTEFPDAELDDVLELFVHREGVERAVAYAWTSPDAERIGLQLRYLQGSCSRDGER